MNIAVTGATGFLGRYIVNYLTSEGHRCRCWYRSAGGGDGFLHADRIEWIRGELNDLPSADALMKGGIDGVVHAALYRAGEAFRGGEGDVPEFARRNVLGSLMLIESARQAGVPRFVFVSTCAVHEIILDDRRLDEAHPLWPTSHYGAHKAAIEKFVHSYGLGDGYAICALRPTGIYGLTTPPQNSKWYGLVQAVKSGDRVASNRGGKEVHAADVAKAAGILLKADGVEGQAYNCYDMYVSDQMVAEIARDLTGSTSVIEPLGKSPRHQIDTSKLRALGLTFGGSALLKDTVKQLVAG